jgi:hypothetical protein
MNEKDLQVQQLRQDVAKWKNRALEACEKACFNCEEYWSRKHCEKCRITKIKEEAAK